MTRITVSFERRLAVLRELLVLPRGIHVRGRGRRRKADRATQAVTLFALLELYKTRRARLAPARDFRPDRDHVHHGGQVNPIARQLVALLFCSPEPVSRADLCETIGCAEARLDDAIEELRERFAPGQMGIVVREVAGGLTLASDPEADDAVRRLLSKPRTPPLSQAQAECLAIVAYLQPVSRPGDRAHPRRELRLAGLDARGPRPDRGARPHAVRRDPVPHHAAVREALRARVAEGAAGHQDASSPAPRTSSSCARSCCARASSASASCAPRGAARASRCARSSRGCTRARAHPSSGRPARCGCGRARSARPGA